MVFSLCYRMLGDRHEAEDVSQEVFLRALRSLHQWDCQRPMRPWLLTIAANRCRTALGRSQRRPIAREYLDEAPDPRASDDGAAELRSEIQIALGQLREDYRCVFVLFHEQGMSYEEMSVVTGRPIGTLKTWLHRARAQMLTYLRERGLAPEEPEEAHDCTGV